jgi:hypothetical protein
VGAAVGYLGVLPMKSAREVVDYYIGVFVAGRTEEAFHGLIDLGTDVVLELIASYDSIVNRKTNVFILQVISESRRPIAFAFLKRELLSDDPQIWKLALDGLAKAQSSQSVEVMSEAARYVNDSDKKAWIMEAIRDTTIAIKKGAEPPAGVNAE